MKLIVLYAANEYDHKIFVENMKAAALPVEKEPGMCSCDTHKNFTIREARLYEISFSNQCKKAAFMYLEDWLPNKTRLYGIMRILLKFIPFPKTRKVRPFNNPGMKRTPLWNVRADVLATVDNQLKDICPTCKKKMYLSDY